MTGTRGLEFLLDLEHAVALRGGDALVLDDNRLIEVVAAPEPLTRDQGRRSAASGSGSPGISATAICRPRSWPRALRIRRDHVIEAMVKGLGARVIEIEAPFDPEGGAYAGGGHGHAPAAIHASRRA